MKTWRDIEELHERTSLEKLLEEECTPTRIARRVGCSVASVRTAMRFYGLKTKTYKAGETIRRALNL